MEDVKVEIGGATDYVAMYPLITMSGADTTKKVYPIRGSWTWSTCMQRADAARKRKPGSQLPGNERDRRYRRLLANDLRRLEIFPMNGQDRGLAVTDAAARLGHGTRTIFPARVRLLIRASARGASASGTRAATWGASLPASTQRPSSS